MRLVQSMSAILAQLDEPTSIDSGTWYRIDEGIVFVDPIVSASESRLKISVMVVGVSGPNVNVAVRSGTCMRSFRHEPHQLCEITCSLGKPGYVLLQHFFPLRTSDLTQEVFSCKEPRTSSLMAEVGING